MVNLVIKARLDPPDGSADPPLPSSSKAGKANEKKDYAFLTGRRDVEEMPVGLKALGQAHAPYWPAVSRQDKLMICHELTIDLQTRKPSSWVMLVDSKLNRLVIPPFKITDVPFCDFNNERNYRSYKIAFKGPQQVATYSWTFQVLSDTFVGDEIGTNILVRIYKAAYTLVA